MVQGEQPRHGVRGAVARRPQLAGAPTASWCRSRMTATAAGCCCPTAARPCGLRRAGTPISPTGSRCWWSTPRCSGCSPRAPRRWSRSACRTCVRRDCPRTWPTCWPTRTRCCWTSRTRSARPSWPGSGRTRTASPTGATSSPPRVLRASLQHDDLHDANIFVPYDGVGPYRVFDWGDASVAHPFTTLLVTLRVVAYRLELAGGAPELLRLRDAYLEPWTGEHDRATLRRGRPAGAADRSGRARPVVAEIAARRDTVGARAPRGRRSPAGWPSSANRRRWTPTRLTRPARGSAAVLTAQHPAYLVHRVLQHLLERRHLGVGGLVAAQDVAQLFLEALRQPLDVGAARAAA